MGKADHLVADAHQVLQIMQLNQAGHVQFGREDLQVDQHGDGQAFGDQQYRVGPGQARFVDLILVDDEVLPQQRQINRIADHLQVFQLALEEGFVGEDAECVGAGGSVGFGDGDRVEVGADYAGAGAGLLDLGN